MCLLCRQRNNLYLQAVIVAAAITLSQTFGELRRRQKQRTNDFFSCF